MGRRPAGRRGLISEAAGLYGPDSEAWALNREAMLLLGAGPRALLLQLAHPQVAAGVADHSDFRADPWARLQGTLRSYLRIVYATETAARAEIRRLNALHRTITGPTYRARDPELALWVHATLVDSTIEVADRWLEPLSRARRERYYAETLPIGRAFGIPVDRLPPDLAAFEDYLATMLDPDGPVRVGPLARELADVVLHPPLGPVLPALGWLPAPAYAWTLWPAVGLLPPIVRAGYGLRWGPLERAVADWLVTGWRAWRPLLPAGFRQMPQALAADRRLERACAGRAHAGRPATQYSPGKRGS
ncbi:MAG TPA: oxygenase MpaB family protein [Candidatus Limnocylindrales bacterium]|nr:oxygenase MpaB family protein [Candidatus Limnocylindrales bacterium]